MFGALKRGRFRRLASLSYTCSECCWRFNGKEHLRHRAVSLRQHGFLVLLAVVTVLIVIVHGLTVDLPVIYFSAFGLQYVFAHGDYILSLEFYYQFSVARKVL